ncbi:MAG: VRR-NUC domain-containing protein [Pleurocapsa sp. SU_196_0]|nr:VRR-NUC domain-containing protein [Pleurocapsa sp. SU_196_0]
MTRPRTSASIPATALARAGITLPTPATRVTRPHRDLEHQAQKALFAWAATLEYRHPELKWLHAVPNGGHRNPAVAAKLKAEGVKRGVLDVFLDVPRGGFHGLRLELKAGNNTLTPEQREWLEHYRANGYAAFEVRGWESAAEHLEDYITGKISRDA